MAAIPRKRAQPPETIFLDRDEIESTLSILPDSGRRALRDRALLVFLYNTGARVQEAADLRASNVYFEPNPSVRLHGKGDKWRVCPLWPETAALLKKLISEQRSGAPPDRPIFTGARDAALTRFGIYSSADTLRRLWKRHRMAGPDVSHLTCGATPRWCTFWKLVWR